MHRHELTDEQWSAVQDLLPKGTAKTGRTPSDPRLMLNGILWILCTGAPWRDLPRRFGPWQTVYDHFRRWRKSGIFDRIVEALQVEQCVGLRRQGEDVIGEDQATPVAAPDAGTCLTIRTWAAITSTGSTNTASSASWSTDCRHLAMK